MRRTLMAAAAALLIAGPAFGQTSVIRCDTPEKLAATLLQAYGETPVAAALTDDGRAVAIYANPISGTWTAASVPPLQPLKACITDFGTDWSAALPPPVGEPS